MIPFIGSEQTLGNLVNEWLVSCAITGWTVTSGGVIDYTGGKTASNVEFVIIYDRITINY